MGGAADMQACQTEAQLTRTASTEATNGGSQPSRQEVIRKAIPDLEADVRKLKLIVPQLHEEIRDVKRDMQLILAAVRGLQNQPQPEGSVNTTAKDKHGTLEHLNPVASAAVPPASPSGPSIETQGVEANSTNLV